MLTRNRLPHLFIPFFSIAKKHFLEKYDNTLKRIDLIKGDSGEYHVGIYNMKCIIDYTSLYVNMGKIYLKLK